MTYREKLQKEQPESINIYFVGGCDGCPGHYWQGAPTFSTDDCPGISDSKCSLCWAGEISKPFRKGKQMRLIDADVLKSILLVDRYRILEAEKMESYIPIDRIFEIIDTLESVENEKQWTEFKFRKKTEEEKEAFPNYEYTFDCELPSDGDEIIVCTEDYVWGDVFTSDGDGGFELMEAGRIDDGMAWMPMPEPLKDWDECGELK